MSGLIEEDPWPGISDVFGLGWIQNNEYEPKERGVILSSVPGRGLETNLAVFFLQKIKSEVSRRKKKVLKSEIAYPFCS
jgi:hypothetical protein